MRQIARLPLDYAGDYGTFADFDVLYMPVNAPGWSWDIIDPVTATNHLSDPSFEARAISTTGNPWTTSASVSTADAYRGPSSLYYSGGTADVATQAITLPSEVYAYASAWVLCTTGTAGVKVTTAGGTVLGTASVTASANWQRVSCLVTLAGNTSVVYKLFATGTTVVYFDACQLEDGYTLTTYFDGMEPGCSWNGRMHLSPSFRPRTCRSGGAIVPLSLYLDQDRMQGWGRAVHSNVMLPFGLQGGSVYQRSVKQSRVASIVGHITAGAGGMDDLHNAQASLGRLLGADLTMPQTPVRMVYHSGPDSPTPLSTDAVYEGGLEFDSLSGLTLTQVPIRLHAPDPAMQEDKEETAYAATNVGGFDSAMYYKPSSTQTFAAVPSSTLAGVVCGTWVTPPYGVASSARTLWLGGSFSSGGYTQIACFDPATGLLTDPGIGGSAGQVNAICQTGNYLWFGGSFTGFSTYSYLCRYNLTTGAVDHPVTPGAAVLTMSYDPMRDYLWIGGVGFTAVAGGDCILFYVSGASTASPAVHDNPWLVKAEFGSIGGIWDPDHTGAQVSKVWDSCVDPAGNLYLLVGASSAAQFDQYMVPLPWSNTTDIPFINGWLYPTVASAPLPGSMKWGPDGCLYVAGQFASIGPGTLSDGLCRYNGGAWQPVRSDLPTTGGVSFGRSLAFDSIGRLHTGGAYIGRLGTPGSASSIGALTPTDGYLIVDGGSDHVENISWTKAGSTLADAPLVFVNPSDDSVLFVPNAGTVTATVPLTVTYEGTAPAPARICVTNGYAFVVLLGGIRNETTGQAVYFTGLSLQAHEVLYVETTPGSARAYSDQRPDLSAYVSPGSDIGSFVLLEGTNRITTLTDSWTVPVSVTYRNQHYGIDGSGSNIASA